MPSSKDILRSANILLQQYGEMAEKRVAERISHFKQKHDLAAADCWWSIGQSLKDLRKMESNGKLDS